MPPVVVAVISIGVTYAATAGLITAGMAALISVGLLVASVAYADSEATKARREARDKYNASQVDRLQNITSTVAARELVLGRVRKGGTVIFRDSCGAHNSKFVMVIALAGHEIDGVEKFFLNEKEVTVDSQGYVTTEPYSLRRTVDWIQGQQPAGAELVSGSCYAYYESTGDNDYYSGENCQYYVYDNYARIRVVNGAQTTADARLMELFPGVWTAEHKLLGVAYAILEFDFNETAFPNGLPNFTCQLRGAKVYDPRTGATAFSTNPALHARHIALHPRFGKRTVLSAREEARIVAAANACDTSYTPSGGTAGALYTSNIVIPFGTRAADALDDLCQAMCGMWGYAGGEFFLKAGVYTAPVKALQASDLLTLQTDSQGGSNSYPIQITTHKARADKINSVTAKIYDAGKNYQENTTTPVENAAAVAKDGQRLPLEINLAAVSTASQAQVICNYMLKDSFDPLMIVASFKLSAYDIELFDNVSLTIPRYGWNAKVFKVFGRKFNPSGSIELTLKETSAQLYNPGIYSNSNGFSVNTNLVEPWEIDDPGVLTMSSGTSDLLLQGDGTVVTRVRVQWAEILDARIRQGGQVEVWWRPNNATNWTSITVPGVESSTYILGANDGSTIVVKARTRTALAVSDWNVQATHLVLGKTEPPSNVTGLAVSLGNQSLNLTWNKVPDLDLAGYEVRSSDSGWGTGNEIYRGNATSIRVEPTGTTTTWYVRAFDKSGNYSATTTSTQFTRQDTPNVTSFTIDGNRLSWSLVTAEFGIAGYEIRFQKGVGRPEWGTASKLHSGLLTSSPYTFTDSLKGVNTFLIKAVDAYGVYSIYPTNIITELGDNLVKNVIESYDYKANSYPGTLFQGVYTSGRIEATQSDYFYRESDSDFYKLFGEPFYSQNYDNMVWVSEPYQPSSAATGIEMFIDYTQVSESHTVEYRLTGPNPFYGEDLSEFYDRDTEPFFEPPPDFLAWPGRVTVSGDEYQFRFTTLAGPIQGKLTSFQIGVDVEDKIVSLSDVPILATGTRLPIAGQFLAIQNVQLTIQSSSAASVYVVDKDPALGPLVYTKDSSGTSVASVVDATIQGY